MKILVIAMANSIHTARWMSQLRAQGWEVRLFPSINFGITHPQLDNVRIYNSLATAESRPGKDWKAQHIPVYRNLRSLLGFGILPKLWAQLQPLRLLKVLDEFQPDIVHAMEFQAAGYLTLAAKQQQPKIFPVWIMTAWGSDIYHFRQFPEHEAKIRGILRECDYFSCECQRDICLAKAYGFAGKAFPPGPVTGGYDLAALQKLRRDGPVSTRRVVMLKGYQHWVGRALTGVEAIGRCADLLSDYEVMIYAVSRQTAKAAKALRDQFGIKITLIPPGSPHEEIFRNHGRARVSIGLSMSDGISVSFLEALTMGAFPIQSWTACADEWIEDGKTGLLVPPEDVDAVAAALRRALTDDDLVDQAAELNAITVRERLDQNLLREQAVEMYRTVAREKGLQ